MRSRKKLSEKKQEKAKLLLEQANSLMEDTQSMSNFLSREKIQLGKDEKQIQKSIIKSSCQKAIKKNLPSVDINNNQSDSDS